MWPRQGRAFLMKQEPSGSWYFNNFLHLIYFRRFKLGTQQWIPIRKLHDVICVMVLYKTDSNATYKEDMLIYKELCQRFKNQDIKMQAVNRNWNLTKCKPKSEEYHL